VLTEIGAQHGGTMPPGAARDQQGGHGRRAAAGRLRHLLPDAVVRLGALRLRDRAVARGPRDPTAQAALRARGAAALHRGRPRRAGAQSTARCSPSTTAPKAPGCAPGSPRTWRPRWAPTGSPASRSPRPRPRARPGRNSRPEPHWGPVRGTGAHLWPVGRVLRPDHRWCRLLPEGPVGPPAPAVTGPRRGRPPRLGRPGARPPPGRWAQSRRSTATTRPSTVASSRGSARRRGCWGAARCARRAA